MINPLILLFNVLESSRILSVHTIISNFLLLLFCRGLFIIIYALNYYQGYDKKWREEEQLSTHNYFIQFALKQVILILLGSLFFPLAVGISFYSLSMIGSYIKQIGLKNELKNLDTFGTLISLSLPIIGFIWFVINEASLAVAAIGISMMVFFYYGQNNTTLTLLELIERNQRRYSRLPKYISIGLLLLLLIIPTIIIVFTLICDTPPVRTYDVIMRDGIKLATDVYIAPGSFGGPRPVILIRTSYGKSGTGAALSTLYLYQGYHAVVQDLRGTFDSEDHETFLMFFNDYLDGVNTLNWILNQSWCNGKIATVGLSALTINSFFIAGMDPDGLVTQSLMVGTPDVYDTAYQGGALRESMLIGWLKETVDNYDYQITQYKEHLKKDNFYAPVSLLGRWTKYSEY